MDEQKIAAAAEECIASALPAPLPFSAIRECIEQLKADPDWTADEIIEVQTRVIRALMRRLGIEG